MFKLQFDTDNAAFEDGADAAEIRRILQEVAERVACNWISGPINDINGNTIGWWSYEKKTEGLL